ncbi:SN protein, partial [Nyctibius bracteatus]|nr:SN protein [Nyctibius bracteatus]
PSTDASEEQTEGQVSTLGCSTPYVCPPGDVTLRWEGYDPQVSTVASQVQLDTSGVGQRLTLTTSFSWKDHAKKLLCEVSHGAEKATGEVVVRVRHAPKDTQVLLSPSAQNIRVGDTVSLTCGVSSSHPPVSAYRWYKDGVAVGNQQTLTLRDVRREDYGRYRCEAENAVGTGTAPTVTLYIFCECPGRCPGLWHRWRGSRATKVQELGSPWWTTVMPPWCHGRILHGTGRVLSPPADPPRAPTVTLFQETQGGHLAIVLCAVDSHPPATMALDRDGTVLAASGSQAAPSQRFGVTASRNALRLEIRGVGPGDSGRYRCTATNAYGHASATKAFVAHGAEVLIQPSAEVLEGTAVTLTCLGAGDTAGDTLYTWYRNGRRLQEGPDPTLSFPSVHGQDAGAFQCGVRSSNGSDTSAPVTLRVLYPPRQPVLTSFLQTQGGRVGIIQCAVESDPEANLTLRRGEDIVACTWGCPVAPRPGVRATSSYNSLRVEISDVVLEDEGTYLCWAGNPQGNASVAVDFRA